MISVSEEIDDKIIQFTTVCIDFKHGIACNDIKARVIHCLSHTSPAFP